MTVVVEETGTALLVRADDSEGEAASLAAMLREEEDYTPLVVGSFSEEELYSPPVVDVILSRLPSGRGVRLVAGGSGRVRPDGTPSPATRLASRLGVEVVAPDGALLVLPGGDLFSLGQGCGWVSYLRGRRPLKRGPRAPEPLWQPLLPMSLPDDLGAQVVLAHVPAGIWLRAPGAPAPQPDDLVFAVPPERDRMAVVLGSPDAPLTDLREVEGLIRSFPAQLRSMLYVTEYGLVDGEVAAGQLLADLLGKPVRARTGLSMYGPDGIGVPVCVAATGEWTWQPYAVESIYHPGDAPPTPWRWCPPAGLAAVGSGCFELTDGWVVEVVPAGMVVREADTLTSPVVARMPAHPERFYLVVAPPETPGATMPISVLIAVEKLVENLPERTRARLRLAALQDATAEVSVIGMSLETPVVRLLTSESALAPRRDLSTMDGADERQAPAPSADVGPVRVDGAGYARPEGAGWRRSPAVPSRVTGSLEEPAGPVAVISDEGWSSTQDDALASAPPDGAVDPAWADAREEGTVAGWTDHTEDTTVWVAAEQEAGPDAPAMSLSELGLTSITAVSVTPPLPPAMPAVTAESVSARESASAEPVSRPRDSSGRGPDGELPPWMVAHSRLKRVAAAGQMSPRLSAAASAPSRSVATGPESTVAPASAASRPSDETGTAGPEALSAAVQEVSASKSALVERVPAGLRPLTVHLPAVVPDTAPVQETVADAVEVPAEETSSAQAITGVFGELEPMLPLLPGHRSSQEERLRFRASLGWRYDAAAKVVLRLLAERPGLRSGDTEAMITELAAVQLFASGGHSDVTRAIHAGGLTDRWPFVSCLAGGLGRLQSFQGVVARGGPDDTAATDGYVVGSEVVDTAPLLATTELGAGLPGVVELLILSLSARRLSGLMDEHRDGQVVFLPSTALRVMAVEATRAGRRVLMAEMPHAGADLDEARLVRITDRLRAAAERRDQLLVEAGERLDAVGDGFAFLPGLTGGRAA